MMGRARRVDGWYYAASERFTFAFKVKDGRVVVTAPVAKFLLGMTIDQARSRLSDYELSHLPPVTRPKEA
jgi:hypothetical protein